MFNTLGWWGLCIAFALVYAAVPHGGWHTFIGITWFVVLIIVYPVMFPRRRLR